MSARRPSDSEHDGDLVDPSFGAGGSPEPPPVLRPSAPPNQANVLVGGGEREARAYVGPTALPAAHVPNPAETAGKVAIASSVDPRRMPTVRISPGRAKPLAPGERPAPPEALVSPFGPVSPRPPPPSALVVPHSAPHSAPSSAKVSSRPEPAGSPATAIWVLAVVLAALIGAGVALYIRRNMPAKEPPPPVPAAPHS
ncbi:hypothetical protein [Polyangium mundeleinium]|uniref:Uncharacterized protein n=1 Tax=Polyangium mundeleinium TaxID=2995306 RepID=A0ABT5EKN4_9BACT|nr:hypothetical protein [Polyangium mundeleinium]MDC0742412.1 hypothetical protein [Polyangium mundeleinium]